MIVNCMVEGQPYRVRISDTGKFEVAREGKNFQPVEVEVNIARAGEISLLLPDGTSLVAYLDQSPQGDAVVLRGRSYEFAAYDPRSLTTRRTAADAHQGPATLKSPMPGRIVRILSPVGTTVEAKQGILTVEAMKMQNELKSPRAGIVDQVLVKEGDSVVAGQALAVVR
jgi:biotin carboxyl carrier protein